MSDFSEKDYENSLYIVNVKCTVLQAIVAFLDGNDFEVTEFEEKFGNNILG